LGLRWYFLSPSILPSLSLPITIFPLKCGILPHVWDYTSSPFSYILAFPPPYPTFYLPSINTSYLTDLDPNFNVLLGDPSKFEGCGEKKKGKGGLGVDKLVIAIVIPVVVLLIVGIFVLVLLYPR
jgi:hypothetical protein